MVAGFIAVLTNCAFNWVLIFGKLGVPALGIVGAAIATVISRYVECGIIIFYVIKKKKRFPYFKGAFRRFSMPQKVFRDITVKGMPLLFNEFFWSLGMSLLSMAYSLYGISVVAGYSISSTVMNLANISFISLGASIGIIIGKMLGANEFEKAYDTDRKLITFSVLLSLAVSVVVIAVSDKIPLLYNTAQAAKDYAAYFIKVAAAFSVVHAFANASYFTIRSGGKTLITFLMDSVFIMCINVPVAFMLYYVFHLDILIAFPIVQAVDIIKVVIGMILIKKRVWLNNIVE
jgi:Na+-driven multidrug efflux pump